MANNEKETNTKVASPPPPSVREEMTHGLPETVNTPSAGGTSGSVPANERTKAEMEAGRASLADGGKRAAGHPGEANIDPLTGRELKAGQTPLGNRNAKDTDESMYHPQWKAAYEKTSAADPKNIPPDPTDPVRVPRDPRRDPKSDKYDPSLSSDADTYDDGVEIDKDSIKTKYEEANVKARAEADKNKPKAK